MKLNKRLTAAAAVAAAALLCFACSVYGAKTTGQLQSESSDIKSKINSAQDKLSAAKNKQTNALCGAAKAGRKA